MAFYDLTKSQRADYSILIGQHLLDDVQMGNSGRTRSYFGDTDTYVRKAAYLAVGKIYLAEDGLRDALIGLLQKLEQDEDFKIRQTVINAAGEIGKRDFDRVQEFFDRGLFDAHHAPRNAVIGSIKKMGEVNPEPVLRWAQGYLHHEDKEIRREICHGIELRGRKHPGDILPMLRELQFDQTARVRNTLVHVIGQIAYKKGCLAVVIDHLHTWDNKQLVKDALEEIIDVHYRYRNFTALTQDEARAYITAHYQG